MARLITGSLTRCSGWSTVMWPLINHMTAAMKWHGNMHGASLITQEPTRRNVNVRQSSSRDADGSFMSVEANPQPIQLWGLKRHFRRLDDKSQNLAATFRVCVCEMFCVSAFGKCCFCADHMLMPGQPHFWSSHFHALVPPGVILLGFSPWWQILFPWDKPQSEDDRLLCGSKPTVHRRYIAY